jgi:hypothetical protein
LAKLERGDSIHAASRQCLEPRASALQIFNDLPVIPMQAGASSSFNRAEIPRSDVKRLEPEPISSSRSRKMLDGADIIEMCTP